MNAKELVRRWKERQSQILAMLPEAIRAEYLELTVAIRRAEAEFAESKRATSDNGRSAPDGGLGFADVVEKLSQRVPLESRKKQVAEFLLAHGPASRSQILSSVSIPNGSLANVLLDKDMFEQNAEGMWKVLPKENAKPPQPAKAMTTNGTAPK